MKLRVLSPADGFFQLPMTTPTDSVSLLEEPIPASLKAMLELTRETQPEKGFYFLSVAIVLMAISASLITFIPGGNYVCCTFMGSGVMVVIWLEHLRTQRRARRQLELTLEILRDLQHRTRVVADARG
jgi:hypothetical protein